jgi:hypothetical protein
MIKYAILRYKRLFIHEGVLTFTDNMNLFGCMFMLRVILLRFVNCMIYTFLALHGRTPWKNVEGRKQSPSLSIITGCGKTTEITTGMCIP